MKNVLVRQELSVTLKGICAIIITYYIEQDRHCMYNVTLRHVRLNTRVVPKVMSNCVLHANWEQQTKESAVVDGTSCCVILECLVTSIACIT